MPTPDDGVDPVRRAKWRRREFMWVLVVVAFTLVRFVVAYETVRQYGLNIWLFGLIDLGTAVPYGLGTARLVESLVVHRYQAATQWAMVAAASFLAPYLYIAVGANKPMPLIVWVVLALLIVLFGGNAISSVNKKVRGARAASEAAEAGAELRTSV